MSLKKELKQLKNDGKWIELMDAIHDAMPFLFSPGRPTHEQIENSEIGRTHHENWSEYIRWELDWNDSGWRAWIRAYKVVLAYPYLRKLDVTASIINIRKSMLDTFPDSAEQWREQEIKVRDKKPRKRSPNTEERLLILEKKIATMSFEIQDLKCQIYQ
ncbi:hypothetical protein LCGC14_0700450 [marine sediment metagenome]|uniref:Uncharacterized protein n=1 Tax=marine sediment metagenome TaxID=412755 RepID=A0A0F9QML3_9ZZZZ